MNINLIKQNADYEKRRNNYYSPVIEQLDLLYHDIENDKLGEEAKTSLFYLNRKDNLSL